MLIIAYKMYPMVTIKQIKAARALLEWKQADLARVSGISLAAINKLERGLVSPRQHTLAILQQSFEQAGVEFTEGPGVRLTHGLFRLQIWDGDAAIPKLLDDVFSSLKEIPAQREFLLSGLDESRWDDYRDLVTQHQKRLKQNAIGLRALVRDGDRNFLPNLIPQQHYRWISKALFTQLPYFVYADKYAMVVWGPPIRVIVIQNRAVTETFRRQFEINWQNAKMPKV